MADIENVDSTVDIAFDFDKMLLDFMAVKYFHIRGAPDDVFHNDLLSNDDHIPHDVRIRGFRNHDVHIRVQIHNLLANYFATADTD